MRTSWPLASIGIPVYNGAEHLRAALDSALAQDYPNFEVVVSDNASTDATDAIIRAYQQKDTRVRCWRNATNLGVSANFGKVFERSSGEYFTILAADDFLSRSDYLRTTIAFLETHPDVAVCVCDIEIIDLLHAGKRLVFTFPHMRPNSDPQAVRRRFFRWPQELECFAVYGTFRRSALAHANFKGRTHRGEAIVSNLEWPILLPALQQGRIVALPEVLRTYRRNPNSAWHTEQGHLSGLDVWVLGLRMKMFLLGSAIRTRLSVRDKLELLALTIRNVLTVDVRTVRGDVRRLRAVAAGRQRVIQSLRTEIDRRRTMLRAHGVDAPATAWPDEIVLESPSLWPLWAEPVRDVFEQLRYDFFRRPTATMQQARRQDVTTQWQLRLLCQDQLDEIHRLTVEAERCLRRLPQAT